ncbi:MAG: DNA polymerase III subunit delta' [Alphaproteobacteria bacterium]|nr:DNA polymerase III subunit delta' [Alphaproteobacteria bacterium]
MTEAEDGVPEPRANPHLVGHESAAATFLDAWSAGRMAHAWLLSGPRGIGKATLAYGMARFMLAQSAGGVSGPDLFGGPPPPASLQMSPSDPVFRKVASQGHPDFRVAEREVNVKTDKLASVIKVDQIRDITSFIRLTPAESSWRVVLIDGADAMNEESANAVLKVLEEPPARSILLLVAHNADRLLPTIRSRCRRVDLRRLKVDQVTTLLGRYRPDLKPAEARLLATLGDGSVGRALELDELGGADLFAALMALLSEAPSLPADALHALADQAVKGDTFRTLTELTLWWLARIASGAARNEGGVAEIVPGQGAAALRLTREPGAVSELWSELTAFAARVEGVNVDKKRATINFLTRIAALAGKPAA